MKRQDSGIQNKYKGLPLLGKGKFLIFFFKRGQKICLVASGFEYFGRVKSFHLIALKLENDGMGVMMDRDVV